MGRPNLTDAAPLPRRGGSDSSRFGKYTYIEYARFADDLVILIDAADRANDRPANVRSPEPCPVHAPGTASWW